MSTAGPTTPDGIRSVLVVGTGLIGTSLGLALRRVGVTVWLDDVNPSHLTAAVGRGAGDPWSGRSGPPMPCDVAVVAVPPRRTAEVVVGLQRLRVASTYIQVASVQAQVQAEIERDAADVTTVVGAHPLAGKETAGPQGADGGLFQGRPWCLCAHARTGTAARNRAHELARLVGSDVVELTAQEHDRAVALVSHLPQAVSTSLAACLLGGEALALAGPGLADTTRLAAGDAQLWTDILTSNAAQLAPLLTQMTGHLERLREALQGPPGSEQDALVHSLLTQGAAGRALVPLKRGAASTAFEAVDIELEDRPGELARLLADAARLGVNIEDLRVDHLPGRPRGVLSVLVPGELRAEAMAGLQKLGWRLRA